MLEHGVTVAPNERVLNLGSGERAVWVPARLCSFVPGQLFKGMINPNQTRTFMDIARRKPHENAELITTAGHKMIGLDTNFLVGSPYPSRLLC